VDLAAAPRPPADGTLAARLAAARVHGFVGRDAELDLVRELLDEEEPSLAVLFFHGPGGIGKSALLRRIAVEAERRGRRAVQLDRRSVAGGPAAFGAALTAALDRPDEADPFAALHDHPPVVLLLDGMDELAPVEPWLRDELLPRLPARTLTVIAGREAPSPDGWREPGWAQLVRSISLRDLPRPDARRLLHAHGLRDEQIDGTVAVAHGYPLALVLLAEVVGRTGGPPDALATVPDVVTELLRRFVAEVPTAMHRQALEVAAHARSTTTGLLRDAIPDGDAEQLFAWLRDRPFMEPVVGGIAPHDLARETLEAELRWRDPDRFRDVHRHVRDHVIARLRRERGAAQRETFADLIYLHRHNPLYAAYTTWNAAALRPRRAGPPELDEVVRRTAELGRKETAEVVRRWAVEQPSALLVFEPVGGGPTAGYVVLLELGPDLPGRLREADPVVAAVVDHLARHAPLREGEHVLLTREVLAWERPYEPSPVTDAYDLLVTSRSLSNPQPAWTVMTIPEPAAQQWEPQLAYLDWPRLPGAESWSDGRTWVAFGHDWRARPVDVWLDLMGERETATDLDLAALRPASPATVTVLARDGFDAAVRAALRSVRRPADLSGNPLLRSRLVVDLHADDPAAALVDLLVEATDELRDEPNGDKLHRAVATTYFKGAPSQEAAAERLGLAFSTFRRHLAVGTAAICERLWAREVHGPPPGDRREHDAAATSPRW
jgi:hypothetical protein